MDEDSMDLALVRALRARGVDVETAAEAGMIDRSDAAHLDFASGHERVLFSFNVRDFHQLHTDYLAQGKTHSGIIVGRQQRYSIGEQMRRLLRMEAAVSADSMLNRIEFLSNW
jgi:Domain of unknown function (DUF5615)